MAQLFRKDEIKWARFSREIPAFAAKHKPRRGAKALGIRYEKQVHRYLHDLYEHSYVASPWITYCLYGGGMSWAQPDGLIFDVDSGIITICEMKYQHCAEAYWQIIGKYMPLLQMVFPEHLWKLKMVEIVRWFDCAVKFPIEPRLRKDFNDIRMHEFAVHIYNP